MTDSSDVYFSTHLTGRLRNGPEGPLCLPVYDKSPRQGPWRLTELMLEAQGDAVPPGGPGPGNAVFLGRDNGRLLAYLANILQDTRIVAIMDNIHLADGARHYLRDSDLVLRVPVFAGDYADPVTWRLVTKTPLVVSMDGLVNHPRWPAIVEIAGTKVVREGSLWCSGMVKGPVEPSTDAEQAMFDAALGGLGLGRTELADVPLLNDAFLRAGFEPEFDRITLHGPFSTGFGAMASHAASMMAAIRPQWPGHRAAIRAERALHHCLHKGMLAHVCMQFKKIRD